MPGENNYQNNQKEKDTEIHNIQIEEDINKHQKEGNNYKCLKMMFRIYVIKNLNRLKYLVDMFNSDLGKYMKQFVRSLFLI